MTNVVGTGQKALSDSVNHVDNQSETVWRDDDSEEGIVRGKGEIVQTTTVTVDFSGTNFKK